MADEIEALLRQVEAENATIAEKLAARQRDRELAVARAQQDRGVLLERIEALEAELDFTTGYIEQVKRQVMLPSPRRTRRQLWQLGIRAGLCAAIGAGAGLLHLAGLSQQTIALALAVPGIAVWLLGDRCDSLEIRHG